MEIIKSPITNGKTKFVKSLNKEIIIRDYKTKYKVDISKYYESVNKLNIYECVDTGYKFYHPFNLAGDGAFYDSIMRGGKYYPDWKNEYEFAKNIILDLKKEVKVLDVGCGNGVFMEEMKKHVPITGLEFSDDAIKLCKEKELTVVKELVEDHANEHEEEYDVVCSFQVLEHVPDVKNFIIGCLKNLKKGGTLVLSVPNNEPYLLLNHEYAVSNVPPHHMGLWNLDIFRKLENHFPIELLSHDYDHDLGLVKAFLSSALSTSKNTFPKIANKYFLYGVALFIFIMKSPIMLYKKLFQNKKVFVRVMVSFKKLN